jgi:HlyD family secretion protein
MSTASENIVQGSDWFTRVLGFLKAHWKAGVLVLLIAGAAVAASTWWRTSTGVPDYSTGKVERGAVAVNVTATGTVQAVTTVQVGTQVSGTVAWLGADFKTEVKKGQVIAKLDPALFQAQVDIAKANLANAQAGVSAASTDVTNQGSNVNATVANEAANQAARDDALALVKQNEQLRGVIPEREIQASEAAARVAIARANQATAQIGQSKAGVQGSKAKVQQAQAGVQLAQAQLDQAKVNLEHSVITSPIDGVVVSRSVDVGQTVSASLSAPTIFTIANDLTSMQVLASIDEADVGQVREGGDASFSVDAFPGTVFTGKIKQVRLNAQALQNVVTYTAVIDVQNPDQKLLPGMTANITITVAKQDNALTVPNAALRFKPTLSEKDQQAITEQQQQRRAQRQAQAGQGAQDGQGQTANKKRDSSGQSAGTDGNDAQRQTVYVLTAAKTLEPRRIQTGITDGRVTQVVSGNLQEGEVVVTGQVDASAPAASRSPQGASPFGGGGRGGGGGGRGIR